MAKHNNTKKKGAAALTTTPKIETIYVNFNDNSAHNQRIKLLDWLLEKNSITTKQAQTELDIYYPPARIRELRQAGYLIETVWDYWISEYGIKHRIGRYILIQKQPLASGVTNE